MYEYEKLMDPYNNHYSHTVPLTIKIICSIFIWLPVVISFITVWHFPHATIIYNVFILIYIIISHTLTYATSFIIFIKQKQIIHRFFHTLEWNKIKKEYKHHKKTAVVTSIEDILHIVLIPIYKEDSIIIENTLKSLAEQNVSMIIGFALEEREINSDTKYNYLIEKYKNQFIKIIKTIHPKNFKNELAGKPSNCNYGAQILVKFYEEDNMDLRTLYNHVMITVCDCDSIWSKDYFLYLNYLCTKNNIDNFNHIVYVPNITNMKQFQSSHILSNWISIIRSVGTHGHFRFLGSIRSFVSEYHIPLQLLKRIDYWDSDIIHEDIHMRNKLAILNESSLMLKQTFLPCDNQTPTDINSIRSSFLLIWDQNVRWNSYIYELYYLTYELLLNIFRIKRYKYFRTDSWKIIREIINKLRKYFFLWYGLHFK